jgi:hypothetical protein
MVHRQQSGCSRGSPNDGFTLASQNTGVPRPVIRRLCLTAGPRPVFEVLLSFYAAGRSVTVRCIVR